MSARLGTDGLAALDSSLGHRGGYDREHVRGKAARWLAPLTSSYRRTEPRAGFSWLGCTPALKVFNAMLGAMGGVVRLDAQQRSTIFRGTPDAHPLPPFRRFASCARRHHERFPTPVSVDSFECAASLDTVLCVARSLLFVFFVCRTRLPRPHWLQ